MNCKDMMRIPELENVLKLKAGERGLEHLVRWIYFVLRVSIRWRIIFTEESL